MNPGVVKVGACGHLEKDGLPQAVAEYVDDDMWLLIVKKINASTTQQSVCNLLGCIICLPCYMMAYSCIYEDQVRTNLKRNITELNAELFHGVQALSNDNFTVVLNCKDIPRVRTTLKEAQSNALPTVTAEICPNVTIHPQPGPGMFPPMQPSQVYPQQSPQYMYPMQQPMYQQQPMPQLYQLPQQVPQMYQQQPPPQVYQQQPTQQVYQQQPIPQAYQQQPTIQMYQQQQVPLMYQQQPQYNVHSGPSDPRQVIPVNN
mmetsp:Transcript_13946/g.20859  ORF Transcript_13946/g.20859 Transcript_13946/m.20859 type:complete len:259 (-) Transcript_13946:12-788(-)